MCRNTEHKTTTLYEKYINQSSWFKYIENADDKQKHNRYHKILVSFALCNILLFKYE